MEGLLSTGPTPTSFLKYIFFCKPYVYEYIGEFPYSNFLAVVTKRVYFTQIRHIPKTIKLLDRVVLLLLNVFCYIQYW